MMKQLVLFEPNLLEIEVVPVLGQVPSEQREVATQLLAELMARSLAHNNSEESAAGGKGEADE